MQVLNSGSYCFPVRLVLAVPGRKSASSAHDSLAEQKILSIENRKKMQQKTKIICMKTLKNILLTLVKSTQIRLYLLYSD